MSHLSLISSKKDDGKVVTFPNSPFRLHQPFPPSGDQPEAIDKLVEGKTNTGGGSGDSDSDRPEIE